VVRYDDPEYVRRFGAAERSRAFGPVAAAYERGRPGYPDEAVRWAVGRNSGTVLDLGAGTGKLTRTLAALGYDTIAVEPDDAMRAVIRETSPSTRALSGWAELIPLPAASVDAVVVAQAWHWFDHARAAAEVARVVRPGGHVALLYNIRDERIPWVARFAGATGERFGAASEPLEFDGVRRTPGFGAVENREFDHVERLSIDDLVALARSFSFVALLPDDERRQVVSTVEAIGRGAAHSGGLIDLPYRLFAARAVVGIA
jgi:SAM-dependent methyltransferase